MNTMDSKNIFIRDTSVKIMAALIIRGGSTDKKSLAAYAVEYSEALWSAIIDKTN